MAKRNQEYDGDATSSAMERWNTVFIDTNLDTHLAMVVSHSDTVLHLKKKILSEHPKCFPNCGKIKIDALKVKRKGFFYHLSDSMLVKSAFEGAKKCWFLSVDTSSIKQPDENKMPNKPEATNQLALICFTKVTSGDNSNHQANSSSNKINYLCYPRNYCNEVQKDLEIEVRNGSTDPCSRGFSNFNLESDCTSKKQEELSQRLVALETHIEHREGGSEAGVNGDQCNDPPKASVSSELGVNKKRMSKKKDKTEVSNYTVKDDMHIDEHSSGMIVTKLPKDTKMEHMDACNIVSEANTDNNDGNSQVGIDYNQCNYPLEGSLIRRVVANKKRKSKKKNEVSVSNCTVKDYHLDIDEYSLGKRVTEVQVDVQMVNVDAVKGEVDINIDAVEGSCSSLLDDKGEFLRTHVETQDVESKNLVCDAQGDAPLEEVSKSKPASKKRKTRESKKACDPQEEHNNENSMINVVVPETSVIVKPKNTTVAENLITEILEDVNLGAAATSSGKKRRKKKISSKDLEVIVEPPSHNPGEERRKEGVEAIAMNADKENAKIVASDMDKASDTAIVSEPNVQHARPPSAVGVGEMEHHDANAEVKSAAPGPGLESGLKGTKKTNKRQSTHVKELPSPAVAEMGNLREDVLSWDEGVRLDNHEVKINGPDKVKEQKELPYNCDKEEMVPEKCERLQAGEEGKSKEAVGSANLAETNINMEPGKSSGSKKLKKRAKKPVSAKAVLSSTECSANTGVDRLSRNEVELLPLTQVNKKKENEEIMQKKLLKEMDTSSRVGEKESKMNSLKQNIIDITPKNIKDSAAEPRNIMKENQNSAGETHSALPIKEQEIGVELLISNYRNEETENASKTDKKRKSGKMSSKNQSTGKHLEPKKSIGNEIGSLTSAVDSAQPLLSDTHNGNSIDRPLEFVNGDVLNNLNVNDANPQEDVLKSKGDGIKFEEYFSPRESDCEAPPVEPVVNAVKKLKSSDVAVKAKKKILVSFENGSERKSHPKNFTVTEHKDTKRSTLSSKKEIVQKASWSNNHSTFAKSSSKGMGEVVNISRREKSLLATPASIFWDYSFESSEDTDSSKKAQSDNSSSSSDSEEENESILDPTRNGVDGALGANDGRSEKETTTPLSKRISMDVILRSSSRFKKAKLSAAQSQLEDTESQAVDNDIDLTANQIKQ